MIAEIPKYTDLVFILTTILTLYLFLRGVKFSSWAIRLSIGYLLLYGIAGYSGFFTVTHTIPPRFPLLLLPSVVILMVLFMSSGGRRFVDVPDLKGLTLIHIVRIPVEVVLWMLYSYGQIPKIMTYEGLNFDILSGISAPVMLYLLFHKPRKFRRLFIVWNIVCLILLINIVVISILSSPLPFQVFAFDQPNIAMQYFPYLWLPACIVPVVLFAHIASLRILWKNSVFQPASAFL